VKPVGFFDRRLDCYVRIRSRGGIDYTVRAFFIGARLAFRMRLPPTRYERRVRKGRLRAMARYAIEHVIATSTGRRDPQGRAPGEAIVWSARAFLTRRPLPVRR